MSVTGEVLQGRVESLGESQGHAARQDQLRVVALERSGERRRRVGEPAPAHGLEPVEVIGQRRGTPR